MKRWALFILFLLATTIRLATLAKLMVFTPDEEYLLYLANSLVKNFHIIWIGVSALGFDFYMGPLWIYIIYPFIAFSSGNPLTLGVISSLLGVFTVLLIYWLGKKLFNFRVGFVAALFYAFSTLIIYYDQQPYPSGVPLLSLLMATSIYMSKYSNKWWILFGVLYGLVFHIHLSLVLVIFVAIYWARQNKKALDIKIILVSVLAFLIAISPLIAFDYFHKWSNITVPIRILKSVEDSKPNLNIKLRTSVLFGSFSRLWYLEPYKNNADEILHPCMVSPLGTTTQPKGIIYVLTLLLIISFIVSKDIWKNERKRLLLLLALAFLVPFLVLPVINPIEYYLLGFFPILFLIIGSAVDSFNKPMRYMAYFLIAIYIVQGIFTVATARGDFGLDAKKKLIFNVMNRIGKEPFDLAEAGLCHDAEGFRYLFTIYGRRPERSSEDKIFSWLYPDEVSTYPIKYSVVIKEKRALLPKYQAYKFVLDEGGFSAYIFEHLVP